MIKDTLVKTLTRSVRPQANLNLPRLQRAEGGNPDPTVSLSREATSAEEPSSRLNTLLGGLASWGQEPAGEGRRSEAGAANGAAPGGWDDVLKSGQMPMSIIRQVFSTMKNAGGMATAGALHSLLSWGAAERKKTGQIREEFQSILKEAIEFAKKHKTMSDEDLAKHEGRLFGDDPGQGKKSRKPKGIGSKTLRGKLGPKLAAALG